MSSHPTRGEPPAADGSPQAQTQAQSPPQTQSRPSPPLDRDRDRDGDRDRDRDRDREETGWWDRKLRSQQEHRFHQQEEELRHCTFRPSLATKFPNPSPSPCSTSTGAAPHQAWYPILLESLQLLQQAQAPSERQHRGSHHRSWRRREQELQQWRASVGAAHQDIRGLLRRHGRGEHDRGSGDGQASPSCYWPASQALLHAAAGTAAAPTRPAPPLAPGPGSGPGRSPPQRNTEEDLDSLATNASSVVSSAVPSRRGSVCPLPSHPLHTPLS